MAYSYLNADERTKLAVWSKATAIPGYDSSIWRRDTCGHAIKYSDHGKTTEYGWEIDHIYPKEKGGSDSLSNLQALYWETNRRKSDKYPWSCSL